MKITKIKLADLIPAEKNVRMHPPEQIKEYKRSLEKFGQTKPIVIDEDNNILIGNGLYTAMQELGWTEAACFRKTGLSKNEKKKLMMADNRIFDLGTDDLSVFDEFVAELNGDFDIPGYSDELLQSLVMDTNETAAVISEYGVVDGEAAESIRRAAEREENQSSTAETPQSTSAPQSAVNPTEDSCREDTSDTNFVICPKCGEKIWL